MKKIFLNIGEIGVSKEPASFETILGSCVAVCLWDEMLRIGGINHFMLPTQTGCATKPGYYSSSSIDLLIEKLIALGTDRNNLKAKIFGGGMVVKVLYPQFNIGNENVEMAREKLKEYGIPIVNEFTGSEHGIRLFFHTETGKAYIKCFAIHKDDPPLMEGPKAETPSTQPRVFEAVEK
jgi:chemotaxis protein CheD